MSFKNMVDSVVEANKHKTAISEASPPGFEGTVKAMKKDKDIDNPYALAWWMKNKGYKSHKKASGASKNESIIVGHVDYGKGIVESINDSGVKIRWMNPHVGITAPSTLSFSEAQYLVLEKYSDKKEKASVKPDYIDIDDDGNTEEPMKDAVKDKDKKENDDDDNDNHDSGKKDMKESNVFLTLEDLLVEDNQYVNVPRPADSILSNNVSKYDPDPLSTMDGASAASDGDEPDGDYADMNPVDAPGDIDYRELDDTQSRRNTRKVNNNDSDTKEVSDKDKQPEQNDSDEEDTMKNESLWLGAEDLGLNLIEQEIEECGDDMEMDVREHNMGEGEIAFTADFLHKVLVAVSEQSPDEDKLNALCDGLKSAQSAKGDSALDDSDWSAISSAASESYGGGSDEEDEPEFEDRAAGDGEIAGPEGGDRHEGKTKMMDDYGDLWDDEDDDEDDYDYDKDAEEASMKRRKPRKSMQYEGEGHKKAPKVNDFGQKPSKDGGSNNIPEHPKGKDLGAADNVFSKGEPSPKNSKPLAAESHKKLDEAIMLGMGSIPGTIRNTHDDVPTDADWDDEIAMIKRRSGMQNWWKK